MKAVIYRKYGLPDVLHLKEVEKPAPTDDDVLVKIHAASINASDWEFLTGKPLYTRMWGLRRPKFQILGSDIAGQIESVGKNVKNFQPGDEVFGDIFDHWGGFAEYVCAPPNRLAFKPDTMSFEEAAAIPQSAVLALQGISEQGKVQSGTKVMINGAGGGAGTFAIQIGKSLGAEVTAVDSTIKLDIMRNLGADHVIDYTKEDFTKNDQKYDLILDFVASHPLFNYRRSLSQKGKYFMVGGSVPKALKTAILGPLLSATGHKKLGLLFHRQNIKDLNQVIYLYQTGKVKPVIDKYFPLEEVPKAFQYFGEGKAKGKVLITI